MSVRSASSPVLAGNITQTLFVLRGVNMTLTADVFIQGIVTD